jgi:hypothetical protein
VISLSGVTSSTVAKTIPGNLTILQGLGQSLICLSVVGASEVTLLAFGFPNPAGIPSLILLQGISDQRCVVLGKAEFRFEPSSLSDKAVSGHVMLGSNGPAIVGQIEVPSIRILEPRAWLISTGELAPIDRSAPYAEAWDVGVRNSADEFEKLLSFPFSS